MTVFTVTTNATDATNATDTTDTIDTKIATDAYGGVRDGFILTGPMTDPKPVDHPVCGVSTLAGEETGTSSTLLALSMACSREGQKKM